MFADLATGTDAQHRDGDLIAMQHGIGAHESAAVTSHLTSLLRAEVQDAHGPTVRGRDANSVAVQGKLVGVPYAHDEEVRVPGRTRPRAATVVADRMKLHRHRLRLRGQQYTVVTLRPGTQARFSTNFYHQTWHILSDWHGARLLGRLLWGLAYQRVPGTLVLIDRPFLDPNPFDAEPADPIALVPALLTSLTDKAARELRQQLPLVASDGTVRWQTA